jgi:uncharacterized caspase-like protein
VTDKGSLKNRAFKSVEAAILLNEKATKASIFKAVDEFVERIKKHKGKKDTQRDVFMLYLSGHGVRRKDSREQELYFWCHDLQLDNTRRTGLSFIQLGQKITSLPVDVILATDACHSGMAGSDVVRGIDPNELAKRIYSINERGMYILNAARSEQLAQERMALEHGVFTQAILETLINEDDYTILNIMASVQNLVNRFTHGEQTPVFRAFGDLLPLEIYGK